MPKYVVKKVTQLSSNESAAIKQINDNLEAISVSIDDTVSRSGKLPSAMSSAIDMNSNRIINLGRPVDDGDAVRYKDLKEIPSLTEEARKFRNEADAAAKTATTMATLVETLGKQYVEDTQENVSLSQAWAVADDFDDRLGGESSSKAYSNLAMAIANAPEDVPVSLSEMQSRVILRGEAFKYEDFTAEQLAALKGPKGDKGDKGDTGPQGVQGPKGDKGDKTYASKGTYTLSADSWIEFEGEEARYYLYIDGVSQDSTVWVAPTPDSYNMSLYAESGIFAGGLQNPAPAINRLGGIVFKAKTIPTEDINVEVVVA